MDWPTLESIHNYFRDIAFEICAAGEEVEPQLFAVRADSAGRITNMTCLPQFGELMRDEAGKRRFVHLLRGIVAGDTVLHRAFVDAIGFEPTVLVQINEAWVAPQYDPRDTRRPSERADRAEAILVVLHLDGISVVTMHDIVDKPERHAVPGTFTKPEDVGYWQGRFTQQDGRGAPH